MVRPRSLVLSALLLLTGCVPLQFLDPSGTEPGTAMVPTSPFGTRAPLVMKPVATTFAPAAWEASMRVDKVGKTLLAANPAIGNKPLLGTIGAPHAEIFHQGTHGIQITEGLVKQCKTDGELAAVLALELGKMVSEREALAGAKARGLEERLPIGVPIGNAGQSTPSDQVALAELAKYEQQRRQTGRRTLAADPYALARGYLEKAGYGGKRALDAAAPLVQAAERNYIFEKQFKGPANAPTWTPATPQ